MATTILVIEDERKISELICKYLALENFDYVQAFDGSTALQVFKEQAPDLLILDIMLPQLDGLTLLEQIRLSSNIPVILLTARVDDVDRLIGFAKGADDYLCKPFNPQELIARVKAVLRRCKQTPESDALSIADITLVVNEHTAKIRDEKIPLTQMEFGILTAFMKSPNQVFTREELLMAGQGKYSESYERTIDFHIKNLRKKLNNEPGDDYIKTVYGVGYKFL